MLNAGNVEFGGNSEGKGEKKMVYKMNKTIFLRQIARLSFNNCLRVKKYFVAEKIYSLIYSFHIFLSSFIFNVLLKIEENSFSLFLFSVTFITAVKIITNTCEISEFARFLKSEENQIFKMVARRHKKYETGEASNFMSRKTAMKKLQLNLKDFRRLCILKGIHPREPRNRKRAQKGDMTKIKTLYHEKDIRFLMHEPIVWKFRDFKVFLKKLKRAYAKGNDGQAERLKSNKPRYSLDHIVRERYPTFVDAIRDLEDVLCLCFLFATFPKNAQTPVEMVSLCRRLCIEFMHYVIESKSLRKVFVSIKGYYYQAEIMGQTVTWIVPHSFAYDRPQGVDFRLMSIFVEFYTTMLGFVLFRLYHNLNLQYPPSLSGIIKEDATEEGMDEVARERVFALNQSLARTVVETEEDNVELDHIDAGKIIIFNLSYG